MPSFQLPKIIEDSRIDIYLILLEAIKKHPKIALEFFRPTQISPAGHAILACLCDSIIEQRCAVLWSSKKTGAHSFISLIQSIQEKHNLLPDPSVYDFESESCLFKGIKNGLDLSLIEKIEYKFTLDDNLLFDCKLILNELMQNTISHSGAERYFMYAGKWKNEIHLGVLDMGISIPAKLRQKYVRENDLDYILLAMEEGSTTRRQRMGGFGLYYFHHFLKRNRAKLTLVSGEAQVRYYFHTRKSQKSYLKYPLRGSWCFARIPYQKRRIT